MNQPPTARVVKEETLVAMQTLLEQADSSEDFLAGADALLTDPFRSLPLPYTLGVPQSLTAPTQKSTGVDVDNGPRVYEYVGAIDPANAADPRLWTYLAFVTYRDYMERRWPLESGNWKGRVANRWLLGSPTRGRLVRHGIARLWWVSHLTYDPRMEYRLALDAGDQFAYTRAVLGNEDRINAIFDREAGAIGHVSRAVLEHAAQSPQQAKDDHIRKVMKALTLVYGYRDLGALDAATIGELINENVAGGSEGVV